MIFWMVTITLALACGAILALALLRGRVGDAPPEAYDLQVYRDQMKEVDRDLARGVLTEEEAERIRTEVARRILAADAKLKARETSDTQPKLGGRVMAAMLILGLVAGGGALYAWLGVPGYGDLPRAARLAASEEERLSRLDQAAAEARLPARAPLAQLEPDFANLLVQLRQAVSDRPGDVRGLTLLARNEALIGDYTAAHRAQMLLIEAKGDAATAEDFSVLADMMVSATAGYVSSDAELALRASLARDSENRRARYYLGLYFIQIDRLDSAFRTWDQLLRDSTSDDLWTPVLREQLPELAWRAGNARYELPAEDDSVPLSQQQIEAAGEMTREERAEMIRGMVEGLSERIETEGGSVEDWARLTNALAVLGDFDRVRTTLEQARIEFADRPLDLDLIENAAKQAGFSE
ncbi:MAG: c-type cytochrome biogenesis protein CcmI [Pseudomonadota bacterium]